MTTHITKTWFDGDKVVTQEIPESEVYKQEPVAWMRMPKVGDRVVCIEDEDLGIVQSLTAGGSPDIKFDDGSHGTYLLREFAELFRYADTTPPQREWVGLTDEEIWEMPIPARITGTLFYVRRIEAKLKQKNGYAEEKNT